jgi:hypothetical protein
MFLFRLQSIRWKRLHRNQKLFVIITWKLVCASNAASCLYRNFLKIRSWFSFFFSVKFWFFKIWTLVKWCRVWIVDHWVIRLAGEDLGSISRCNITRPFRLGATYLLLHTRLLKIEWSVNLHTTGRISIWIRHRGRQSTGNALETKEILCFFI